MMCLGCSRGDTASLASFVCKELSCHKKLLCNECHRTHDTEHLIETVSRSFQSPLEADGINYCPDHPGLKLSFYCFECRSFLCNTCILRGSFCHSGKPHDLLDLFFEERTGPECPVLRSSRPTTLTSSGPSCIEGALPNKFCSTSRSYVCDVPYADWGTVRYIGGPDGAFMITNTGDTIKFLHETTNDLSLSPDGHKLLAITSKEVYVFIRDGHDGSPQLLRKFSVQGAECLRSLDVRTDGTLVLADYSDEMEVKWVNGNSSCTLFFLPDGKVSLAEYRDTGGLCSQNSQRSCNPSGKTCINFDHFHWQTWWHQRKVDAIDLCSQAEDKTHLCTPVGQLLSSDKGLKHYIPKKANAVVNIKTENEIYSEMIADKSDFKEKKGANVSKNIGVLQVFSQKKLLGECVLDGQWQYRWDQDGSIVKIIRQKHLLIRKDNNISTRSLLLVDDCGFTVKRVTESGQHVVEITQREDRVDVRLDFMRL